MAVAPSKIVACMTPDDVFHSWNNIIGCKPLRLTVHTADPAGGLTKTENDIGFELKNPAHRAIFTALVKLRSAQAMALTQYRQKQRSADDFPSINITIDGNTYHAQGWYDGLDKQRIIVLYGDSAEEHTYTFNTVEIGCA